MDTEKFKYIIGQARENEVAVIRFFGRVTEDSTNQFNTEFDYLESVVRPKLIRVLINSDGGSVLYGMTTYSTIQNSRIETECIIEGMAASMGSIIWAAGNRSLMRDYAILMIHNPFQPDSDNTCKETSDMVKAFTQQIETIYRKRFGLTAEHVRTIMNGQADKEGTYFDAASAVKAGIIPTENILNTSKQLCDKVRCQLFGVDNATAIEKVMGQISATLSISPDVKPFNNLNFNQNNSMTQNSTEKNRLSEYAAIAATLGLDEDHELNEVMTRINALASLEAKFKENEKLLADTQSALVSKETIIAELQQELSTATTMVQIYQKKEELDNANRTQAEKDAIAERLRKVVGEDFQFLSLK